MYDWWDLPSKKVDHSESAIQYVWVTFPFHHLGSYPKSIQGIQPKIGEELINQKVHWNSDDVPNGTGIYIDVLEFVGKFR